MPSDDEFGLECGKYADRSARAVPVRRVIHGGTMHFGRLRKRSIDRFLSGRDECIAHNQRPVGLSPERNMPRSVAGSGKPAPAWHVRNGTVLWKRAEPPAHIDRPPRKERR